jgi:hypothetical protein
MYSNLHWDLINLQQKLITFFCFYTAENYSTHPVKLQDFGYKTILLLSFSKLPILELDKDALLNH